ncbi:MAG: TetR/AcrR family transcriptional regulator [Alphaproteobacteria bacterium]
MTVAYLDPHQASGKRAAAHDRKRHQILDAAARVFRHLGYDGTSMNEVASSAGVSKPTLYAYFESKEVLFQAIVEYTRPAQPELALALDPRDPDMAGQLSRYGRGLVRLIISPENIAIMRMVIGAVEKFPSLGRRFFSTGPHLGHRRVQAYLDALVSADRLDIPDTSLAAWQFIDLVQSPHQRIAIMEIAPPPSEAELAATVERAVAMFLSAHRVGESQLVLST